MNRHQKMFAIAPLHSALTTLALLGGMAVGVGCSDRQADPDYTEVIRDACEAGCSTSVACGLNESYDDFDECMQGCTSSMGWEELNQCDSRRIALWNCQSELTCEDYALWDDPLDPEGSLKDNLPCGEVALEFYSCNPDEPFDPPK